MNQGLELCKKLIYGVREGGSRKGKKEEEREAKKGSREDHQDWGNKRMSQSNVNF